MKCIKAIRATKYVEVDTVDRVSDVEAKQKVDSGYWKFIPKSEWKLSIKPTVVEEKKEEKTIAEKQMDRKKKVKRKENT
jgi:hypothetical protein